MLVNINVGSSLNPVNKNVDDATLLRDVITGAPSNSQISVNGVTISVADLGKSLSELNIEDGAHILYNTKQNSGRLV